LERGQKLGGIDALLKLSAQEPRDHHAVEGLWGISDGKIHPDRAQAQLAEALPERARAKMLGVGDDEAPLVVYIHKAEDIMLSGVHPCGEGRPGDRRYSGDDRIHLDERPLGEEPSQMGQAF
jgi:hypothetical protein